MKSRKTHARYGIFDLFFLLLLLLSLLGIGVRVYSSSLGGAEETEHVLAMGWIPGRSAESAAQISEGAALYTAAGEAVGYIRSVRRAPAEERLLSNGSYCTVRWPASDRVDVTLELELLGGKGEGGFLLLGREVWSTGGSYTLYTDTVELCFFLLSVSNYT